MNPYLYLKKHTKKKNKIKVYNMCKSYKHAKVPITCRESQQKMLVSFSKIPITLLRETNQVEQYTWV